MSLTRQGTRGSQAVGESADLDSRLTQTLASPEVKERVIPVI
jgi:hypothetical protein